MTVTDMTLKITVRVAALAVAPVEPAIDAINEAVQFLALKLADRDSDLARSSYARNTTRQSSALPPDFNGFYGKPSISGKYLEPLPSDYDLNTPAGTPQYYEVIEDMLYVYPAPLSQITIAGKYWVFPEPLMNTDAIPFSGKFDSLLLNMAVKLVVSGYSILSQQQFSIEVERGLDAVLFPRKPALPTRRPYHNF